MDEERFEEEEEGDYPGSVPLYEPAMPAPVPEQIKNFVAYLHRSLLERNLFELNVTFETHLKNLTERYYKVSSWPTAAAIAPLVNNDQKFLMVYKELQHRHYFAKLPQQVTYTMRIDSWHNYMTLFSYVLASKPGTGDIELPMAWVWAMLDEFVAQFQAYWDARGQNKHKSDHDINLLAANPEAWSACLVLSQLQALITKSSVAVILRKEARSPAEADASERGLVFNFGYFAQIALQQVHVLLGDYYHALKVLDPIELDKKGLFTRVIPAHVTLFYHLGFSYMMARRYTDAIRTLSNTLLYVARTNQIQPHTDAVTKKGVQMEALLAICTSLSASVRADDAVLAAMKESHADKLPGLLLCRDISLYEELFAYACPRFVHAAAPTDDDDSVGSVDALKRQQRVFLRDVVNHQNLPLLRSFLKLYTSIDMPKLANFLDFPTPLARIALLCHKHKSCNLVNVGEKSALSGQLVCSSDVEFYIEQDMVHVLDTKVTRRFEKDFLSQINKCEEISHQLHLERQK